MTDPTGQSVPTRRALLLGAGAASAAGLTLSGCGGGGSTSAGGAGSASAPSGRPSGVLGPTSAVPVGGGTIFPAAAVVVTQPSAGEFKGFSTRCPHAGCAVASIADGFIVCPCHGSRFAVATGAPTPESPAKQPLASVSVSVQNGEVVAG